MTPSTDSNVKKVICSGEERGCQPGRAAEQGADVTRLHVWGHVGLLGPPAPPPPAWSPIWGGDPLPTPTTRVSGRFQETMPTSPDSASCRRTSPGVRMGRGPCQAAGPRAAPTLGHEPPEPCGPRASPGAAGPEGQPRRRRPGETADSGRWRAWGLRAAPCRAANPGQELCHGVTAGDPGPARVLPSPDVRSRQSRAELPRPLPCHCCSTPRAPPRLRLHKPAQGSSRSASPQRVPQTAPHTLLGAPIPHTVTLGEPPGFSHNALQQPGAEGGGAAGPHSPGTGGKFSTREPHGPGGAGLRQTLPRAAPSPDSPRSRPKTGRSAGSWRRA